MSDAPKLIQELRSAIQALEASTAEEDHTTIVRDLAAATRCHRTLKALSDLQPTTADAFSKIHQDYIAAVKEAKQLQRTLTQDEAKARKDLSIAAAFNLPKVELRPFEGSVPQYPIFKATFDELVHSAEISDASKLTRLLQYTQGKAHDAIKACAFTDGGYQEARGILERRFGCPHAITHALVKKLKDGKQVKTAEEVMELANDLEVCASTLRSLRTLSEVESQGLIVDVVRRMPAHAQHRWRRKAVEYREEKGFYPSFDALVEFARREAETENDPVYGSIGKKQVTETTTTQPQRHQRNSHAAQASRTSAPPSRSTKCRLCSSDHKLIVCRDFRALTPGARLDFVNRHSLCHVCFYDNHSTADCKRPYTCTIEGCGLKHSKFIHIYSDVPHHSHAAAVAPAPITNVLAPIAGAPGSAQPPLYNVSAAPAPDSNMTTLRHSGFMTSAESDVDAFIPTIDLVVHGETARAVLDSGSNATFITRDFADRLGLKRKKTMLSLATLHGNRSSLSDVVDFDVSSIDGRETLAFSNVFVTDAIPLNSPPISSLAKFRYLRGLCVPIHDSQSVDILIGQDNGEALIPLEVRRGAHSQPFAVRTLFGWSVNGPLHHLTPSSPGVVSNLVSASRCTDSDFELTLMPTKEKPDSVLININEGVPGSKSLSVQEESALELENPDTKPIDGHFQVPILQAPASQIPNVILCSSLCLPHCPCPDLDVTNAIDASSRPTVHLDPFLDDPGILCGQSQKRWSGFVCFGPVTVGIGDLVFRFWKLLSKLVRSAFPVSAGSVTFVSQP